MTATAALKKTSPEKDWHPAEVVAAMRKRGLSLRQLALLNGYTNGNSLNTALRRPYPQAEALIAEALGVKASEIWPTRYGSDDKPNRGPKGQKALLPAGAKPSRLRTRRNLQTAAS